MQHTWILRSSCPRIKLAYLVPEDALPSYGNFLLQQASSHDHEPFHLRRSSIASGNNCSWHDQHLVLLGAFSPAVSFGSLSDCKRLVLTSIFICFRTGWDNLVHMCRFHQLSSPWCLTNLRILYRPRKFKWPQELISKYSSYHRNHIIRLSSDDHGILVHMHHRIISQSMHHSW
jgi:hypothetical protein